jgi:hypothetical protein
MDEKDVKEKVIQIGKKVKGLLTWEQRMITARKKNNSTEDRNNGNILRWWVVLCAAICSAFFVFWMCRESAFFSGPLLFYPWTAGASCNSRCFRFSRRVAFPILSSKGIYLLVVLTKVRSTGSLGEAGPLRCAATRSRCDCCSLCVGGFFSLKLSIWTLTLFVMRVAAAAAAIEWWSDSSPESALWEESELSVVRP